MTRLLSWTRPALWVVGLVAFLPFDAVAMAQVHLRGAESAYADIDFERTLEEAEAALAEGGYGPEDVARIYELLAKASAAQGDEERAVAAYRRLIALRPDVQVDTNLAPRLRSPFMEARGYWASRTTDFSVEARWVPRRGALRVELSDPLSMASQLRVRARALPGGRWEVLEELAQSSVLVPVEGGETETTQVEYVLEVLDANGNRLLTVGSEDEPVVWGTLAVAGESIAEEGPTSGGGVPLWVWIGAGVLVAGAAATGLYFGLREQPVRLRSAVTFD